MWIALGARAARPRCSTESPLDGPFLVHPCGCQVKSFPIASEFSTGSREAATEYSRGQAQRRPRSDSTSFQVRNGRQNGHVCSVAPSGLDCPFCRTGGSASLHPRLWSAAASRLETGKFKTVFYLWILAGGPPALSGQLPAPRTFCPRPLEGPMRTPCLLRFGCRQKLLAPA